MSSNWKFGEAKSNVFSSTSKAAITKAKDSLEVLILNAERKKIYLKKNCRKKKTKKQKTL